MPELADSIAVIAAYRFVDIDDAPALRERLFNSAEAASLKGTVLVASEGINLSLAGPEAVLRGWLEALGEDVCFADPDLKWHQANQVPFARLRVELKLKLKLKLKREIIHMNQPTVRPHAGRAPTVDALTLARGLQTGRCDAGRPLVMLDARNAFEVDAGTGAFEGALDWRLSKFSDFPAALSQHAAELQGKTVVSYGTGGIRCEKAALWMTQVGVADVLQLDGGILRYFEQTQAAPRWHGHCAEFDEREAVDTALAEAP